MKTITLYLAAILPLAILFAVGLYPFVDLLYISTTGWVLTSPGSQTFVGLESYQDVLTSSVFARSLTVTGIYFSISLIVEVAAGTLLAYLTLRETHASNLFATLVSFPIFIPAVAVAFIWKFLLDGTVGPIPQIFGLFGLATPSFLGDPVLALMSVSLVDIWQWTPFVYLVVLAGMRSIPPTLLEAATVDGSGPLQLLGRIVLPIVKPFVIIAALFRSLELIRDFAKILVLAPAAAPVITYRAYEEAFLYFREGLASVYAVVVFAFAFILATLLLRYLET